MYWRRVEIELRGKLADRPIRIRPLPLCAFQRPAHALQNLWRGLNTIGLQADYLPTALERLDFATDRCRIRIRSDNGQGEHQNCCWHGCSPAIARSRPGNTHLAVARSRRLGVRLIT